MSVLAQLSRRLAAAAFIQMQQARFGLGSCQSQTMDAESDWLFLLTQSQELAATVPIDLKTPCQCAELANLTERILLR